MFKLSALTIAAALSSVSAFANCIELSGTYISCRARFQDNIYSDVDQVTISQFVDKKGVTNYKILASKFDGSVVEKLLIADDERKYETFTDGAVLRIQTSCLPTELTTEWLYSRNGSSGGWGARLSLVKAANGDLSLYGSYRNVCSDQTFLGSCKPQERR